MKFYQYFFLFICTNLFIITGENISSSFPNESFNLISINPVNKPKKQQLLESTSIYDFNESKHTLEVDLKNRLLAMTLFYYKYNRSIFLFNGTLLILRILQNSLFGFLNDYSGPLCKLLIFFNPDNLKHDTTNTIVEDLKEKITILNNLEREKVEKDSLLKQAGRDILTSQNKLKTEKNNTSSLQQDIQEATNRQTKIKTEIIELNKTLNDSHKTIDNKQKELIIAYQKTKTIETALKNILFIIASISLVLILLKFFKGMNVNTMKDNLFINVFGNFHRHNLLKWSVTYHISAIPLTIFTIYFFFIKNETFNNFFIKQFQTAQYNQLDNTIEKENYIKSKIQMKDYSLNMLSYGFAIYSILNQIIFFKYIDSFLQKKKYQGSVIFYLIDSVNEFKYQEQMKKEEEEFKAEQKILAEEAKKREKEDKAKAELLKKSDIAKSKVEKDKLLDGLIGQNNESNNNINKDTQSQYTNNLTDNMGNDYNEVIDDVIYDNNPSQPVVDYSQEANNNPVYDDAYEDPNYIPDVYNQEHNPEYYDAKTGYYQNAQEPSDNNNHDGNNGTYDNQNYDNSYDGSQNNPNVNYNEQTHENNENYHDHQQYYEGNPNNNYYESSEGSSYENRDRNNYGQVYDEDPNQPISHSHQEGNQDSAENQESSVYDNQGVYNE